MPIRNFYIFSVLTYLFAFLSFFVIFLFFWMADLKDFKSALLVNLLLWIVPFIVSLLITVFCYKKKKKSCAEYDYSFLTGSIRIAMVPRGGRRYAVTRFDASCVEKIGLVGTDGYERYRKIPGIKKRKLTSNKQPSNGCNFYYIVANYDGKKHLYIFDCTENFIKIILTSTGKYVLDK